MSLILMGWLGVENLGETRYPSSLHASKHKGRVRRDKSRGPDPRLLEEVGDLATHQNF